MSLRSCWRSGWRARGWRWPRGFRMASTSRERDTVFALSSAQGRAGVAVIRVSGAHADQSLTMLTKREDMPPPRTAVFRSLFHPRTQEMLDQALVLHFPQPRSFTGEDVVELQVHGSRAVIAGVLDALGSIPDFRMADPGEFTQRAFANGKMDLVQIEALADLLNAETEAQRKQALHQLSGETGAVYEQWRTELVRSLAHVEALIDFGDDEDDVTDASFQHALDRVSAMVNDMRRHLADGRRGEILRSGVRVAIVGPPNAGKSSLLNVMAKRPAAIVSAIAGTTRDVVQVPLNLAGYPVVVSDTAGLRVTESVIEQEGVMRAHQAASDADIRIVMIDMKNASELFCDDAAQYLTDDAILVLNKSDLTQDGNDIILTVQSELRRRGLSTPVHALSCRTSAGVDALVDVLSARVHQTLQQSPSPASPQDALITRERHRQHLLQCMQYLELFLETDPMQSEIAAEHLRYALQEIGRILGRVDVEHVLDVLFADFCIGK